MVLRHGTRWWVSHGPQMGHTVMVLRQGTRWRASDMYLDMKPKHMSRHKVIGLKRLSGYEAQSYVNATRCNQWSTITKSVNWHLIWYRQITNITNLTNRPLEKLFEKQRGKTRAPLHHPASRYRVDRAEEKFHLFMKLWCLFWETIVTTPLWKWFEAQKCTT